MKQRFNINKRVLVAIGVVVTALVGLVVLLYIISNDRAAVENPGAYYGQDAEGFSYSIDEEAERGTSNVVSVEQIQLAFGEGATVAQPETSGVLRLGTVLGETATYVVDTPQGAVTFEVDSRTYASKDDIERAAPFAGAEEPTVQGIGEEAHYLVPFGQERMSEQQVALLVVQGNTSYKFAVVQQADRFVYDEQTAKNIVRAVAERAQLDAVK